MAAPAVGSTGAVPGNESSERFPEYCLHTGSDDQRPLSLSLQSTTSSSEYSERDTDLFDSRRASIISTASSFQSVYTPVAANSCSNFHNTSSTTSPQPLTRSRRDAKQLHAARLQRSGSTSSPLGSNRERKDSSPTSKTRRFHRGTIGSSPQDALAATEPPHEQGLTRMAFAEQQRWITVQQKTFTKWLNTKLQERELEVKDLVADLSDGVRGFFFLLLPSGIERAVEQWGDVR